MATEVESYPTSRAAAGFARSSNLGFLRATTVVGTSSYFAPLTFFEFLVRAAAEVGLVTHRRCFEGQSDSDQCRGRQQSPGSSRRQWPKTCSGSASIVAYGSLLRGNLRFVGGGPVDPRQKFGWRSSRSSTGTRPRRKVGSFTAIITQPWSSTVAVPGAAQGSCLPFRSFRGRYRPC
jgi:hypothetical protein